MKEVTQGVRGQQGQCVFVDTTCSVVIYLY